MSFVVRTAILFALLVMIGPVSDASIVFVGVNRSSPYEYTAQRLVSGGSPDLVLGNGFANAGSYGSIAIRGNALISGRFASGTTLSRWDVRTGARLDPLVLNSRLPRGGILLDIGSGPDGDLYFASSGYFNQQRSVYRYSVDGTFMRSYTNRFVQHVQGSPAANRDAVFVASRYLFGRWREDVLMFRENGSYVGTLGIGDDVGDVSIMGNQLFVLRHRGTINVYDLRGVSRPTLSRVIRLPTGVSVSAFYLDSLATNNGYLYVTDSFRDKVHKLDLSGRLVESFAVEARGRYTNLGQIAFARGAKPQAAVPEPSTQAVWCVLGLGVGVLVLRRRSIRGRRAQGFAAQC